MQSPVSFDIDITKSAVAAPPAIKLRLEASISRKHLTLQEITQKLSHATEKRAEVLQK